MCSNGHDTLRVFPLDTTCLQAQTLFYFFVLLYFVYNYLQEIHRFSRKGLPGTEGSRLDQGQNHFLCVLNSIRNHNTMMPTLADEPPRVIPRTLPPIVIMASRASNEPPSGVTSLHKKGGNISPHFQNSQYSYCHNRTAHRHGDSGQLLGSLARI